MACIGNIDIVAVMVAWADSVDPGMRRFGFNPFGRDVADEIHADLLRLAAAGAIRPAIGRRISMEEAGRALDEHQARRSVGRTVVEIGPGRGMLTDLLVRRAKKVIGIELDRVLAAQMRMRYATLKNVEILESDFVTVEWTSMVGRRPGPLHDLRPTQPETVDIVGNLPYYITSDIVLRILDEHPSIGRAVIMVQREVADRIAASAGLTLAPDTDGALRARARQAVVTLKHIRWS